MLKHEWMRQRERRAHPGPAESDDASEAPPAEAAGASTEPEDREAAADAEPVPEAPEVPEHGDPPPAAPAPEDTQPPAEPDALPPSPPAAMTATEDDERADEADAMRAQDAEAAQPPAEAPAEPPAEAPPARRAAPRRVAEGMEVPLQSLRDRLESVLARQAQLPLDIDARHAVSEGAEGSPRATREALVQRLLDPTLTLEEVSLILGVCRTTVRRYTDRGVLRCFRTPGNQRRFNLSDVLDFMEQQSRRQ